MRLYLQQSYFDPITPLPMQLHRLLPISATRFLPLLATLLCAFSARLYAQMPPNMDFASGNFTNWTVWTGTSVTGTSATGAAFTGGTISAPIGGTAPGSSAGLSTRSRHAITSGSDTDYYGGFPIVAPLGGTYSARIGNDVNGAEGERLQYNIQVPATATSYNLQVQYAVVFEDPAHDTAEQPTFQVIAYDSATGAVVPAANNLYVAGYVVPGFFTSPKAIMTGVPVLCLGWTTSTINLSGMAGKTVILEVTNLDCALSGHFGYGYFDVVGASSSLSASLISYNSVGDSALLQGPPGYKTYQWYNQDFSQALNAADDTARTKMLPSPSSAEYYNLIITPFASIGVPDTIQSPVLKPYNQHVGVSTLASSIVSVYPNPSSNTMHLSFPSPFSGTLSLVNSVGQTIYTTQASERLNVDIATASYPVGRYTLIVKDDRAVRNGTVPVSIAH
jgi:hypothetical protein